jgi:hypothetical protein
VPVDYKELKKLYEGYVSAAEELDEWLKSFLLENAQWLLGNVKDRTPVDTGNLRRRWRITNVYRLPGNKLGFVLANDADYASYVEYGHATRNRKNWVEGYYMATINIAKLEERLPKRFNKEFSLFLKRHGVL